MKLKIPRGTKPTVVISGISHLTIGERGYIRALLDSASTLEELETFGDLGITITNDDDMAIAPALWTRVEVIQ